MLMSGLKLVLSDCEAGQEEAFNKWYDQDHIPEMVMQPELIGAKRYVATAACKGFRFPAPTVDKYKNGTATYACLWTMGGDIAAGTKHMRERMAAAGERGSFPGLKRVQVEDFKLVRTFVKPGTKLEPNAVPFLVHKGILLGIWEMIDPSPAAEEKCARWYEDFHIPDLLVAPGFNGALFLKSIDAPAGKARYLDLWFTEGDPVTAAKGMTTHAGWVGKPERQLQGSGQLRDLQFVSPYEAM